MRLCKASLSVIAALLLSACGGDGNTGPNPTYQSIAGSYAGAMAGVSQGVVLDADFSLTLNQTQGNLSGSYALVGTLNEAGTLYEISGTGVLTGTVGTGDNPNVTISVQPALCQSQTAQFAGAYDSTNRRLTITGPVEFFDDGCNVILTYQMTIILDR
jgi:hypothetical protein